MNIIDYSFYSQHAVKAAKLMLGKILVFNGHKGIITETEAYRGSDDSASHAFNGITKRNHVMFGNSGHAYVYMIYGMYHCLNIVTEAAGIPSAVLIRGLILNDINLDGPGKICRHLGISKKENGLSLLDNKNFFLADGVNVGKITATSRIGIKKAIDKKWRFVCDISKINNNKNKILSS